MKNNFFLHILLILFYILSLSNKSFSNEIDIKASEIQINKETETILAIGEVKISDNKNNFIEAEKAEFNKLKDYVKILGKSKLITSEGYIVEGEDISYDNKKKIIFSEKETKIFDKQENLIEVNMFNYLVEKNMFFSKGKIKIKDSKNNEYFLSEIYIDEKKRKLVGTDIKAFFESDEWKVDKRNEPRFFANSAIISKENIVFDKGVFTSCKNRDGKCPPWIIRAKKIKHDSSKKTIYYDNAVVKIYDFPIFYFPKFFHPDPTVKRQSGFLMPTFKDNSTVGLGSTIPYYWAISGNRDLTITPKLYANENILIMNEYRHAFENSYLIVDTSYTEGYKKVTNKNLPGSRSHFFSKFNLDFSNDKDYLSNLEVNLQRVSNPTYFRVHDINTTLVDKDEDILKSEIKYEFQSEDNYFGFKSSLFEDTTDSTRSRYEYILPNINYETNLFTSKNLGLLDLSSTAFAKNYNVDQYTKFFVNDLNWKSKSFANRIGFESDFEGLLKFVNYEADNAEKYKTDGLNTEIKTAIGYNTKLPLAKKNLSQKSINFLTPKFSLRLAPNTMRNLANEDLQLSYSNLFSLNKNSQIDVVEEGMSASLGFEIAKNELLDGNDIGEKLYSLNVGQTFNQRENKSRPNKSSLDQQVSDLVGEGYLRLGKNFSITNKFSLDNNFNDINYNDLDANLVLGNTRFNMKYLEENNHIGNSGYIKSDIKISFSDANELAFDIKKNLETDSTEFYNLAYNYINDCLKAGLVFRREFYSDRDIESTDSIMFKISLLPFGGEISTPEIDR